MGPWALDMAAGCTALVLLNGAVGTCRSRALHNGDLGDTGILRSVAFLGLPVLLSLGCVAALLFVHVFFCSSIPAFFVFVAACACPPGAVVAPLLASAPGH